MLRLLKQFLMDCLFCIRIIYGSKNKNSGFPLGFRRPSENLMTDLPLAFFTLDSGAGFGLKHLYE